jgi:hypothetical protein
MNEKTKVVPAGDLVVKLPTPVARRTAEEIAIARGWLPADGTKPRSLRDWPNWWKFAAAFGHKPAGQEVTEAEFDKAVTAAINAT